MTGDKILEVLDIYEAQFKHQFIDEALAHVRTMIPKVRDFVREKRIEKAFRWLGFMQGVLWTRGVYTLDELKDHNRPPTDDTAED